MDIIKETITAEKCIRIGDAQALVEGTAALPEGFREIGGVLETSAVCEVLSQTAAQGSIGLEGKVRFSIVYIDKDGEIRAFESECSFIHRAEDERVCPEMQVLASANICECMAKAADEGVFMRALIGIDLICVMNEELMAVTESSVTGKNIEKLVVREKLPRLAACGNTKLYITDEVELPQNLPVCSEVLLSRAYAVLGKTHAEEGKLILEGDIRFFILYRAADKNAPLRFFSGTLPFGEIIQEDAACEELFARLQVERLGISCENGNTFIVSAVLGVHYICTEWHEASFVSDVYSPLFDCETEQQQLSCGILKNSRPEKRIIRLPLHIPDSYPEAARVLSALGHAQLTAMEKKGDKCELTGVLSLSLCYATADAGIRNIRQNIPFECEAAVPMDADVQIMVEVIETEGAGYELDLKLSLFIDASETVKNESCILTDLSLSPAKEPAEPGIIVYYAGGEETFWDIAKTFRADAAQFMKEDYFSHVPAGKKLLIIRH